MSSIGCIARLYAYSAFLSKIPTEFPVLLDSYVDFLISCIFAHRTLTTLTMSGTSLDTVTFRRY